MSFSMSFAKSCHFAFLWVQSAGPLVVCLDLRCVFWLDGVVVLKGSMWIRMGMWSEPILCCVSVVHVSAFDQDMCAMVMSGDDFFPSEASRV